MKVITSSFKLPKNVYFPQGLITSQIYIFLTSNRVVSCKFIPDEFSHFYFILETIYLCYDNLIYIFCFHLYRWQGRLCGGLNYNSVFVLGPILGWSHFSRISSGFLEKNFFWQFFKYKRKVNVFCIINKFRALFLWNIKPLSKICSLVRL